MPDGTFAAHLAQRGESQSDLRSRGDASYHERSGWVVTARPAWQQQP